MNKSDLLKDLAKTIKKANSEKKGTVEKRNGVYYAYGCLHTLSMAGIIDMIEYDKYMDSIELP